MISDGEHTVEVHTLVWRTWWQLVTKLRHDADEVHVAKMFALCGGDNIMDDDMLSRTTTISGGGECKVFANSGS